MDIRQLRALLAVVDHGSFSAAATALFTVQSNVSAHISHLEDELGHQLIDRRDRSLTPTGRAVAERARTIVAQLAAIQDDIAAMSDRVIGEVRCGATPVVGLWVLPGVLAEAAASYPDVDVQVVEAQSDGLMQRLERNQLDLAITTGIGDDRFPDTPLFDEEIVALVPPDHPLAGQPSIRLDQLEDPQLLVPLPDNPLYLLIERAFDDAQRPMGATMEIGSSSLAASMAAEGVGIAIVPASAVGVTGPTVASIEGLKPRRVALRGPSPAMASAATNAIADILVTIARTEAASRPGCTPVDGLRSRT